MTGGSVVVRGPNNIDEHHSIISPIRVRRTHPHFPIGPTLWSHVSCCQYLTEDPQNGGRLLTRDIRHKTREKCDTASPRDARKGRKNMQEYDHG